MKTKDIICWWSGGITSAVACKAAIDIYRKERCRVIMIDTYNEDDDTYRFKDDCEKWYEVEIEVITGIGDRYKSIQDVWEYHESLNVANGAVCSSELKRRVRERWQKDNEFTHQVFGFEFDKKEFNRAMSMRDNHSKTKPIFPLMMFGYNKEKCLEIVTNAGIEIPNAYKLGFHNNNCLKTGCVQGGIGYWQKMKRDFPDKFEAMADMEWKLTELRGQPVTMLKDQSRLAKESGNFLVFLRKHPEYPHLKSIDEMPQCEVRPLQECNGFCNTNMYNVKNPTQSEINFEQYS